MALPYEASLERVWERVSEPFVYSNGTRDAEGKCWTWGSQNKNMGAFVAQKDGDGGWKK